MARTGLAALPVEILIEICSFLCCHCQGHTADIRSGTESSTWAREEQAALLSLSQTCRVLSAVAQPFLYHHLYTRKENCELDFFVRTLSEWPALQRGVSEVVVSHVGWELSRTRNGPSRRLAAEAPEDRLENLVEPKLAAKYSPRVDYGALVSSLLRLTPKLRRASVRLSMHTSFETLNRWNGSLTLLKELAFSGVGDRLLDRAAPIIRLAPNLEILHCHDCVEVSNLFSASLGSETLEDPRPLQNLTELSLTDTTLTAASLRNILRAVGPRLSKISIQPRGHSRQYSPNQVTFEEALVALQLWAQTLRELVFCPDDGRLRHGCCSLYTILRDFEALEILRVDAIEFNESFYTRATLSSRLPASVRELSFWAYGHLNQALWSLLGAFLAGKFPALSRIETTYKLDPYLVDAQELSQIIASFRTAGVDFMAHVSEYQCLMNEYPQIPVFIGVN